MFLVLRLLSASRSGTVPALAVATFLLGLGLGVTVGPVIASRGSAPVLASAEPASPPSPTTEIRAAYPSDVLRVLDGDTFEARVNLWPGLAITTRVRLRGIDAPELKARCAEERSKAEAARDALARLLDQGGVGVSRVTLDKYGGRVVAAASTRMTADVSAALLDAGLVRRYGGGRRDSWCS